LAQPILGHNAYLCVTTSWFFASRCSLQQEICVQSGEIVPSNFIELGKNFETLLGCDFLGGIVGMQGTWFFFFFQNIHLNDKKVFLWGRVMMDIFFGS
jgi:hypothetical protein